MYILKGSKSNYFARTTSLNIVKIQDIPVQNDEVVDEFFNELKEYDLKIVELTKNYNGLFFSLIDGKRLKELYKEIKYRIPEYYIEPEANQPRATEFVIDGNQISFKIDNLPDNVNIEGITKYLKEAARTFLISIGHKNSFNPNNG